MQDERLLEFPKSFVLSITPRNLVLILLTFLLIHRGYIFLRDKYGTHKELNGRFTFTNKLLE